MQPFPKRSARSYTLPLALGLGLLVGTLWPHSPRFEDRLNQLLPSELDPRLLIVAIDDATLNEYGALPTWYRGHYANALKTAEQAGAQVVGLDIVFGRKAEQDNLSDIRQAFSAPNVVLATLPGDTRPLQPEWKAVRGVSALNQAGKVRLIQTAYPLAQPSETNGPALVPSFAAAVANLAGAGLPLDTTPRLIRYVRPDASVPVVSFLDLSSDLVRYADLEGRVILIGQLTHSAADPTVTDIDGEPVPALMMQARAVSTLLQPPLQRLPAWVTVALCVLAALLALALGGLWAYALAGLALLLSVALWKAGIIFPGLAVSLTAVLAAGLVAFERAWQLRTLRMRDPLTGLGNRATFNRLLTRRWQTRDTHPFALAMVDLSGFRQVNEAQGRAAGDALLRDMAQRLQKIRPQDEVFRWGADEFTVLLSNAGAADGQAYASAVEQALTPLISGGLSLQVNVGVAHSSEFTAPPELLEGASRLRYRAKYQRVKQEF